MKTQENKQPEPEEIKLSWSEAIEILENCIQKKLCESSKINKLIFTKRNKDIKEKQYAEVR